MRVFKWIILNGVFAVLMYMAYVIKIHGAENIVSFCAWFVFVVSFITILSKDASKSVREKGYAVPVQVSLAYGVCVVMTFLWFSAFGNAIVYILSMFFSAAIMATPTEEKEIDE